VTTWLLLAYFLFFTALFAAYKRCHCSVRRFPACRHALRARLATACVSAACQPANPYAFSPASLPVSRAGDGYCLYYLAT